jgi:hypothetical protein
MSTGINIEIGANGATAAREIRKVGSEIRGLGGVAKAAGVQSVGLGVAVAGVTAAMGAQLAVAVKLSRAYLNMVGEVAEIGDQTAKMARNVGLSADALQTLQFASGRAGVEATALNNGLKRLSRNMLDSISGNTRMADTFEAIGVKVQNADGSLRSVEDVFKDLADVSASLGESAEGTGLRMLLLGRSGAELGNLMAQGAGGVDTMQARLDELGGRMSGDLLDASEAYKDAMLDLETSMQGLKFAAAEAGLPAINEMIKGLTDLVVKARGAKDEIRAFLGVVGSGLAMLPGGAVGRLAGSLVGGYANAAKARAAAPGVDLASSMDLSDSGAARKRVAGALSAAAAGSGGRGSRGPDPAAEAERAAEAEQRRADTVAAQIRAMERRMELSTADAEAQIRLSATFEEQDIARRVAAGEVNAVEAEHLRILNEQRTMLDLLDLRRTQQADAAKIEADESRRLHDEEEQRIRDLMTLEQERAAVRVQIAQQSVDAVSSLLGSGAEIAGQIYERERKGNVDAAKKAFEVRKGLALAQAAVNTALAVTNAIATAPNFIVGALMGAAAGVMGGVSIAAIAAEQPSFGDAGMMPLSSLRDTHRSAIIRNDEMVVDPRGTRDVSAMFAMMRRQMEIGQQGGGVAEVRVINVLDGEVVTDIVERKQIDRTERGGDFRQYARA